MSAPTSIRVVSYNVLSSHLARTSQFPSLNPAHLEAANRLPVVLKKLEEELDLKKNTVICLQEVSRDWAGDFHVFFANRGYHFVTGLYGSSFGGYMGVAIAWPTDVFETKQVDISRLSEHREWPRDPDKDSIATKIRSNLQSLVETARKTLNFLPEPPIDPWAKSENRHNILVTAALQHKETGAEFNIGCYHMPCVFYAPKVMSIHCELAARRTQELAGTKPYVLAGDWNIKPKDSTYQLLITGDMDPSDPAFPEPKFGTEWKPLAEPMRSAYAVANGSEPDFTNNAKVKENDPFIETLDYIFLSDQWTVSGVKPLKHRDEAGGPFPNLDVGEPSDHVLIAADLELA